MTDWDYIESGFNAADETINFGTRNFAGLDNLYETSTLALIKCTKESPKKRPSIRAAKRNGSIFLSIDNTLKVFKDSCSDLYFNVTFDDEIDVFTVTSDGKYLLLCLQNGVIHCFEMQNGAVIYTENILENNANEQFFLDAFVESETVMPSFLLILRNGKVYRITTTDVSPATDESQSPLHFEFKHDLLTDLNVRIQTVAFLNPLLMITGGEVYTYNVRTKEIDCNDICCELKRLFSYNRMFLGLNWNGHLFNICTKTLLTYAIVTDTIFDDIVLIHDASESHILGVTKKNEHGISYLQLLTYPDYSNVFSLKMTDEIHLITPEHIHDEVLYISEVKQGNNVAELRCQVVSETSPENRFKRLLRRQKFDEAEQCAKLFQLDLTELQKAKAQVIVNKTVCCESDIAVLLNILNTVDDDAFKIQSCLRTHSSCNSLKDVDRILNYGCSLSSKFSEECNEIQESILKVIFRFNTFKMLVRCGGKKYNVQEWNDFSECCLIKELRAMLEHNYIEESIIIYTRLDTATISELSEKHIHTVLDVLNNVSMEERLPFLSTFVPLSLSYLPSSLDLFIKWIIEKVFQTETKYPNEFPEIGLKFMKKMEQLLKVESSANINFQQQCTTDQDSSQQLTDLLEALEQLQCLKNNYRIVVPLQQFFEPKEMLIQRLLLNQVISIVDNEAVLEDFIQKFMLNYELEPDAIFMAVIKGITKYTEEYWVKLVPVILNAFSSVHLKLKALLIILKAANVPWCTTIREIANQAIQYSHPLVEDVILEIEYEPKCVIFNKYKIKKRHINSIEDLKHAMSRIIYCNEPSMIDDVYQVCKDSKEKHEANILLIINFIKKGKLTEVLQILNNNSQEEVVKCCKHLDLFASFAIDNEYKMHHLQDNCYQILGSIFQKLQDQERLETLRSVYKIQKHFNLNIIYQDLDDRQKKKNILENLISCTVQNFQEKNDILECTQNCEKISTYLGIGKNIVLLKLYERIGDINVILGTAENMYLSDADVGSLCQIVALMLKCIGTSNISPENRCQKFDEKQQSILDVQDIDLPIFTRGIKLAEKMIVRAILKSNKDEIGNCIELANWVQTTCYMMQSPMFLRNSYRADLILPSVSSLNAIKNIFLSYQKMIGPIPQPQLDLQYSMYFDDNTPKFDEVQLSNEIQCLQSTITCLCTEGHALMTYRLLGIVQRGLVCNANITPDICAPLNDAINNCTMQLLQIIFDAREIDADLAYSLLLSCDPKYSNDFLFRCLKFYKREAPRFKMVAQIFLRFLQYYNIKHPQRLCMTIICLFKWWDRIKNCKIPYDVFFREAPNEVITKLIKSNHLNIASVKEFCLDFKLDEGVYYQFYLKNLLLNWKADYTFQTNRYGKKLLIVKNDGDQLVRDCMEVIDVIKNKESVCDLLKDTWNNINFYHYEVFLCILNISSLLDSRTDNNQKNLMLTFLKNYNRVAKPEQTEEEEWFSLYPDTQCIDLLSEWRLPFTPTLFTSKIWNIIRPEINLKTYTKWYEVISILKKILNKDVICSYAIKDVVTSGVFHKKTASEWVLHARHNDLLMEVDACLQNMTNLEQATSAIYHVTINIPGGADQVNAITLCYKYAQKYLKQSPKAEDVQKAVIKVRNKYFSFSAAHILHRNQLADKQYLDMVSGPIDELIESLYMDDRIVKEGACVISYCPDINNAVNELAALYNIDVQEIRKLLLKSWLCSNTSGAGFSMDTSLSMVSYINNPNNDELDDCGNLIRASYICRSGDISAWRTLLLQQGDIKSESKNLGYKANALKCFCNISDIKTIEKLTGTRYDEFRNFINKLMLLSSLEFFGLSLNLRSLDGCNKNNLLSRLGYNLTSPIAIKAMALVCIAYNIQEVESWSAIMSAMLKLNMVQELKECVIFLKRFVIFHNKKFYIDAWQAVINNSFNSSLDIIEEKLKCLYIENFYMIQSCPVLFTLDFEYVIKQCLKVKKYDFAALAVQYLTKEKQAVYFKEILNADQDIYKKVSELADHGFWVSHVLKMIKQEVATTLDII